MGREPRAAGPGLPTPGARAILLTLLLLGASAPPALARQDSASIPVRAVHVRGGVYAMLGTGANQSVAVSDDGLLVVDAGYAELGHRLLDAMIPLGGDGRPRPPVYLVDTHWHFDHVGANATYVRAGATVVAHEETAALVSEDRTMPALDGLEVAALPAEARPSLVFSSSLEIPWEGSTVEVVHAPGAHTGGDAVVYFHGADVVHVGDLFFNGMYPFIDVDHGGSLAGIVSACERILSRTGDDTRYVPGHGPLADRSTFQRYADMLRTVQGRIGRLIRRGLSRDEVIAAKPTADLDAAWSRRGGFAEPDVWVGLVYDGATGRDPGSAPTRLPPTPAPLPPHPTRTPP